MDGDNKMGVVKMNISKDKIKMRMSKMDISTMWVGIYDRESLWQRNNTDMRLYRLQ